MMEGNFRTHYYDKVGFRLVEEKKSLEILLKEKPIDRIKLKQFGLRFPVPAIHRYFFWELILGISPDFLDQQHFVKKQREEQYQDLYNTLRCFQINNIYGNSPPKSHLHLIMKHLEMGTLKIDICSQLANRDSQEFILINEALIDIFECDSDLFWITKKVSDLAKSFRVYLPSLILYTNKLLFKEDEQLYVYIKSQNMLNFIPLEDWYAVFFAGIFPIISIQRIWDKIIGGSNIIMVFFVVSLFTRVRTAIFKINHGYKLIDYLKSLNESIIEQVVNDAIEKWQQNGYLLAPGSGSDFFKEKDHNNKLPVHANLTSKVSNAK